MARIRHIAFGAIAGLAILLVGTALPATTRPVHAAQNCDVADSSLDGEEQAFLTLINNYRAQNGAPALNASGSLNRASTWMAADMAAYNYFNHTDRLGRTFDQRMAQCDVAPNIWSENIAAWYETAASVFDGWKNSPGHNTNMLNAAYRSIGISRVRSTLPGAGQNSPGFYWVTNFSGEVVQAGPPPAPPANAACSNPAVNVLPQTNTGTVGNTFVVTPTAVCNSPSYQFWVGKAPHAGVDVNSPEVSWEAWQSYGVGSTFSWTPGTSGFYHIRVWVKNGAGSVPANGWFDTSTGLNLITINPLAANAACTNPGIDIFPRTNTGTAGNTFVITPTAVCTSPAYQFWVGKAPHAGVDVNSPEVSWEAWQSYGVGSTFAWTPGTAGFYYVRVWSKNGMAAVPANGWFDTAMGLNIITINPR